MTGISKLSMAVDDPEIGMLIFGLAYAGSACPSAESGAPRRRQQLNPLRQTAATTGAIEQAIHVLRKALGTN